MRDGAASAASAAAARVRSDHDYGRPVRVAVLSNPDGGFNRRRNHFERVREIVAEFGVPHREVSHPRDIFRTARELDTEGTELLIVNGGDGTVQMVLTALFSEPRETTPPLLVLLPGGTSNTIPGDVGWGRKVLGGLREVLEAASRGRLDGDIASRSVLHIESSLWERPQCAMQFSAGAVYNAITFAKREIEGRGAHGQTGPAVTLALFVVRIATGRIYDIFPPMQLDGTMDGRPIVGGAMLGNLVSTLDHLFLGIRPFWGTEPGRVRHSSIRYRPSRFLLALPAALYGKRGRFVTPENGYASTNGERLEITLDSGFTLDGELFHAPPGTQLCITAPATATFLRAPRR